MSEQTFPLVRDFGIWACVNEALQGYANALYRGDIDLLLTMSVNPGFGGQSFIPEAVTKIKQAKALIGRRKIELEVDGGINPETAPLVVKAGANVLVAGNAVFAGNNAKTYKPRIKAIRDAATTIRV